MLKQVEELYLKHGVTGLLGAGRRFAHWNIPQYRRLNYWLLWLFNRDYEIGECNGRQIKLAYTQESYIQCHNLLQEDLITRENIPLSTLDATEPLDAVVDVGGHYGIYSVLLAKLNPKASLYSFEPDEQNVAVLRGLLDMNGLSDNVEQKVVTGHTGTTSFYVDSESGSESHSTTPKPGFESIEMETVALSDYFEWNQIDSVFVKIDAEGEEFNILKDLLPMDYSHLEGIVEIHPDKIDTDPSEVISLLQSECDVCDFITDSSPSHEFGRPVYYFKQ